MPYDSLITRSDAQALMPEEVSREILDNIQEGNPLLQLARPLPRMSRAQRRMPVLNALATAYFVSGDTGLKQTTELDWTNKYIDAEELAVIVPIPETVLDDADYDIWGEVRPEVERALNIAITQAVLYGTNIPASWTTNLGAAGIVAFATAASQVLDRSTLEGAGNDLFDIIMGEGGLLSLVEEDGFMVSGHIASLSMRAALRGLRNSNGDPIFVPGGMQGGATYTLDGEQIYFPRDGSIDPATSLLISGDWNQLVFAMRQDITYKILTEAVIQDGAGAIVYNLAQQDMVALRAVMRLGFALPNPINRVQPTEADRSPFAVLVP